MKIVINRCYGGFGLSPEAVKLYFEKMNIPIYVVQMKEKEDWDWDKPKEYTLLDKNKYNSLFPWFTTKPLNDDGTMVEGSHFFIHNIERTDPILIDVVEELGEKSWDGTSELEVVEIPDGIGYYINDYDGLESIHESHRSW